MAGQFHKHLADAKTTPEGKTEAARRLIAISDNADSVALILKQITPNTPPDTQRYLMETLATSREPSAGKSIIERWNTLTPAAQRSALAMVLRKSDWTASLLDAIAEGKVD